MKVLYLAQIVVKNNSYNNNLKEQLIIEEKCQEIAAETEDFKEGVEL